MMLVPHSLSTRRLREGGRRGWTYTPGDWEEATYLVAIVTHVDSV